MGRQHHVVAREQRVAGLRRPVENVDGGAGQPPVVQCGQQGIAVDQAGAGGVDQHGARFDMRQRSAVDQAPGRVGQRRVQADHIGRRQQCRKVRRRRHAGIRIGQRRIIGGDRHAETVAGDARDLAADPAVADEAEAAAVEGAAHQGVAVGEAAPAHRPVADDEPTLKGQQQGKGMFGHGLVVRLRRDGDRDAARRRRRHVDGIGADADAGDGAEGARPRQQTGVDGGVAHDDPGDVGQHGIDVRRAVAEPGGDGGRARQAVHRRPLDRLKHEDERRITGHSAPQGWRRRRRPGFRRPLPRGRARRASGRGRRGSQSAR